MKKNTKIALAVLAVLVVAAATVFYLTRPDTNRDMKNITVTVIFADGSKKEHEFKTNEEFLYDAIKDILDGSMQEYGFWIQGVDGVTADDSKEQWWGINDGNGEMLMTGVSETPINDGDSFQLVLNEGYDW